MRRLLPLRFLLSAALLLALSNSFGCTSALFQGVEPSARTFYEDPNPTWKDYYVGMDFNFVMDNQAPHTPSTTNQFQDVH